MYMYLVKPIQKYSSPYLLGHSTLVLVYGITCRYMGLTKFAQMLDIVNPYIKTMQLPAYQKHSS